MSSDRLPCPDIIPVRYNTPFFVIYRLRQLRLYGHVARYPLEYFGHQILSCRDPSGWPIPNGRPHAFVVASGGGLSEGYGPGGPGVCLGDGQTEAYLKDMDMTGLASAWVMARRRPREYRRKVDAATHCSGVSPHT